jgi:hypothetical protein
LGVDIVARSISLALAGLFALAAIHKSHLLLKGDVRQQPLVAAYARNARESWFMVVTALLVEAIVIAALIFEPATGYAAAACVSGLYAIALRRLDPDMQCACFGELFAADRSSAIRRNVILGIVSTVTMVSYLVHAVAIAPIGGSVLGITMILTVVALAGEARQRLLWSAQRSQGLVVRGKT